MGTSLKAKSLRAVMKLSVGAAAGYGMKFVRRMILARLLAPSEIGVMAIVVGFSMAFEAFTEVGVKDSVIQNKKGAEASYLNVTWWLQVVRGLFLFLLAILSAPWISAFYDKPELLDLLRVSFLAILFKGLVSPRAYVLEKEYRFGRSVMLNQGSAVLGAIVTIVLAFLIRNVWALVIGFVAEMAILCLISFIFVPIVPRFKIDRQSFVELMKFARGMFGLPVLAFVSYQMPVLVLGKIIPDDQLGFYSYAMMLAYFPIMIYTKMVGPVLLPAFSKKQSDNAALCRGLLLVTRWTGVSGILLATYMACCSSELLYVIYKPEYAAMAIPFAVLCVQIIARTETAILAGVYLAVGRPHLHRRYSIARAVVIVSLIYPASVHFGALGAAGVIVVSNLFILFLQVLGCQRIIGLDFRRYVRCYVPGLVLALPIALTFDLLWLFEVDHVIWVIGIGSFVFIATLATSMFIVSRSEQNVQNHREDRRPPQAAFHSEDDSP
ncbi:MAG: oligosaccharide flippase family protein [Planctomycetota bacterium]